MRKLFAISFISVLSLCAQTPSGAIPKTLFGITIHDSNSAWPTVPVWALKAAPQVGWVYVEPNAPVGGVHSYNWSHLDAYISAALAHGAKPFWVPVRIPRWAAADTSTCNYTPAGGATNSACTGEVASGHIADWDAFITTLVTRYVGRMEMYELWNEAYNTTEYTGSAAHLVLLTQHYHDIVRAIDPAALIGTPSLYGFTTTFMNNYYNAGGTTDVDVATLHGESGSVHPESIQGSILTGVRSLLSAHGMGSKPLWDTEAEPGVTLTAAQHAAFVGVHYILHWSLGIVREYWYGWDVGDAGLQLKGTIAGTAYQVVQNWLVGSTMSTCSLNGSTDVNNAKYTCALVAANGTNEIIAWHSSGSGSYTPPSGYTSYTDLTGALHSISGSSVPLTGSPVLITGSTGPSISSFTASPTSITSGSSSTLSWSTSGATGLTINQSIGSVSNPNGSRSVSPTTTTTYTLTANNSFGTVTRNATVTVSAPASSFDVYIAQSAAGSANGSSCATARAYTYFNNSANWTTGTPTSSQIGPGTTVHLCGTFTFAYNSAGLIVSGSGTSGKPITIKFETGAILQSPYFLWAAPDGNCFGDPCGGAIDIFGKSYITIDGQNAGVIRNTANGSSLANKQPSAGVFLSGDHLMVKNLTVQAIYANTSAETSAAPGFMSASIRVDNQSTNIEICNSYIQAAHGGIWSDTGQTAYANGPTTCTGTQAATGINYHHNTISDHGWQVSANGTGYLNIYNNDMSGYANWFYPTPIDQAYHLDGIITFSTAGGVMRPSIYNNYLHGDFVGYPTGFVFCTYGGSGSGSSCAIFNNLFVGTSTTATNGQGIYFHSADGNPLGPHKIFNNTFDGFNFTVYADGDNTQVYTVENNIYVSHGEWYVEGNSSTLSNFTSNYNLYFGGRGTGSPGVGAFSWGAASTYDFAQWKGVGKDLNGKEQNPLLASNFQLLAGSPAIGMGTNLTSQCTGVLTALCTTKPLTVGAGTSTTGTVRPSTGPWDAGAYQFGSGSTGPPPPTAPLPPTNLSVVVH